MSVLVQLCAGSREDIVSVLGLPQGAVHRLRFSEESVSPQVRSLVDTDQIAGTEVVIAFVSDPAGGEPFVLPLRYAEVRGVERLGPLFVIEIQLAGFADLVRWPDSLSALVTVGRDTVSQLTMNKGAGYYPVTSIFPAMPAEVTGDLRQGWYEVARRTAIHPSFGGMYLLCIDSIETADGVPAELDSDGRVRVLEGTSLQLVATYYAASSPAGVGFEFTCAAGAHLNLVSGAPQAVDRRHDAVELLIQVADRAANSLSTITVGLGSVGNGSTAGPAVVKLPVLIVRSRLRRVLSWSLWILGSAAATLINSPDVEIPWPFKVAVTVVGIGLGVLSRAVVRADRGSGNDAG
jgi:hypothetical protein